MALVFSPDVSGAVQQGIFLKCFQSRIVMMSIAIKQKIRAFIIENFLFGDDKGLEKDTSFLDNSIVDSTGILELVAFLEDHFNIRIDDREMIPENLDSINNVTMFIEDKISDGSLQERISLVACA
jgi:acyl carrier protein